MQQPVSWLRSRLAGPPTVVRTVRQRQMALPLAAALSLLGAVIAVQPPPASAASSAYTVSDLPVGPNAQAIAADTVTNTIYAGAGNGVDVINGASHTTTVIGTNFIVGAVAVDSSSDTVYAFSIPDLFTADVINGATDTVTATISVPFDTVGDATANPKTHMVYVTEGPQGIVEVIDGVNNSVTTIRAAASEHTLSGVAVDSDTDMIYVADTRDDQLIVINGATNTVSERIALPAGSSPAGVAVDPAAGRVYVADQGTGAISVIDTTTDSVSTLASGMTQPDGLAFDSGSGTLYATSTSGSADGLGTTYVIDAASGVIAAQIPRGGSFAAVTGGSAYVDRSPGALASDVTVMTPSTTTTMSPVIVSDLPADLTVTVGQAVQDQLAANATPAATFSATGLPAGLTLSPSGLLSGTPAAGTGGEYFPVVTASNGTPPAAISDLAVITVDEAPAITSGDHVTFHVGAGGSFTVTATGSPTPAFSETGALPQGVSFVDNVAQAIGVLSGTPTAGTVGVYPIKMTAANSTGTATQAFTLTVEPGSSFVPAGPVRVLDTRNGTGGFSKPVGPGGIISLQVTGRDGVPATGVTAVVLNVTAVSPTASSYVTVYPDGAARPNASSLNFTAGETIPNLVVVPVGADGKIDFYNHTGSVNLVADLAGYDTSGTGSAYVPVGPSRVLDTRYGIGSFGSVDPGGTVRLQVTGRDGVPTSGVTAVVLNVTAVSPTASSYVTVYPDGSARPNASNLNFTAGETIPNLVIVPVGADGKIDFYNNAGIMNLVADLAGYYTTSDTGSSFEPGGPSRMLDTRNGTGGFSKPVGPGGTISLQVTGRDGVPATGVTAVVLNVTAVSPTASSYVTVYPDGTPRPTASNLNFTTGETIPNLVIVPVGAGGKVNFYNNSGSVNLIADLAGYYTSP
jgi:YVTN family beta-propeller protein